MKPKPKTKKFVGYVPKGETIKETLDQLQVTPINVTLRTFGMNATKKDAVYESDKVVKRTITLTWEDEEVKEKK